MATNNLSLFLSWMGTGLWIVSCQLLTYDLELSPTSLALWLQ